MQSCGICVFVFCLPCSALHLISSIGQKAFVCESTQGNWNARMYLYASREPIFTSTWVQQASYSHETATSGG